MPNDYRYNPFSNAPQYINVSERHIIPSQNPYYIRLNEVPNRGDPSTVAVKAIGNDGTEQSAFTEVAATPAGGQFRPDYGTGADGDPDWNTGLIEFNAADAGKLIEVGYQGEGTLASLTTPRWPSWMTDYGDGSDGHVLCANGQSFDGLVQAKSFIVPYGVTVNIGTAGIPLIIRSQGAVIIAGTINGKGKGADDFERNGFNETIGWGDDGNSFVASVPVYKPGYGTGGGIGGRSGIMYARYTRTSAGGATVFNGKTFNLTTLPAGLISLIARRGTGAIGSMGGMMDDTTPDANYKGGDGGGGLVIVAPEILVAGFIDMSGTDGIALSSHNPLLGSRGYSSGGGGGGTVTMAARAVKVTGSVSVAGGLSPVPSGSNARPGQPGEDGWVKIFALGVM